jgi:uncharacterized MnhB-related membrane protein
MIDLYAMLVFMIIAALIAVEMEDLLSAVISVSAIGLGISMTFLVRRSIRTFRFPPRGAGS